VIEKLKVERFRVIVQTPVEEEVTQMLPEEIAQKMTEYRQRHPEQFAGTPEWMIKVTAENAAKVFEETGILFHIM
jgi:hypothetical protein